MTEINLKPAMVPKLKDKQGAWDNQVDTSSKI